MKTPREILFQRHQSADSKLNALRRDVLGRHCAAPETIPVSLARRFFARFWQELFLPCRRIWTGLAAVWALLLILNFAQHDSRRAALSLAPSSPEMTMTLRQEQILNELFADRVQPVEADRPRSSAPRPRSEAGRFTMV